VPPARFAGDGIARRGMVWSGRVDGRVRVSVEGRRAWTETVNGAPVVAERADFFRDLPRRDNDGATVRRLRGRGRVEMVEFPSRRNGYRLVFEIDDSQGGAENYEVEVGW
jgi:CYTH domain-containing protein